MKTATVLLLGVAAIGVTVVAVALLKPKTAPLNPAPGANTTANGSWMGIASGLINLGGVALKTYGGSSSPKPTTPGQLANSGGFYDNGANYAPTSASEYA